MATKMEVVLSPGNLGGEAPDGGAFRNEDVREWSRVDRITGMLERARVETGRWRADTQEARQSYGKMIDSRERNSADGSLVQKARRQVEIFQSQENSGRSFQVVRASQWSSSRATDCGFDIPISNKPSFEDGASIGSAARLKLWRSSLSSGASDLEQLSCLCRKLHNEALDTTNQLWSLGDGGDGDVERLAERRSNSTEDVSSPLSLEDSFSRDCKTRRSLQIARQEFVAERARRFEEAKAEEGPKSQFVSSNSFRPIANNDFVKNDPKHPSKFTKDKEVIGARRKANNKTVVHLRNEAEPSAENGLYGMLMDSSSSANGLKPVKRVEFCKTEIHFAADSGKVNIVETDGKPPPTNKFRRRRRKDGLALGNGNASATQKSSMPLVHFGDTSYEKYIFAGQTALPPAENPAIEEPSNNYEPAPHNDELEKNKQSRGAHTTTVNFLSDENRPVAVPKVLQANQQRGEAGNIAGRSSQGISLQFASSNRGLSPISCGDEDDNEASTVVSRTTKITVHLPPAISQHPGVLQLSNCNPFSNLKSVRLVMNIGQMTGGRDLGPAGSLSLKELFSTLYRNGEHDGLSLREPQMWSLRLKSDGDEGEPIVDESRMITDKPDNSLLPSNHVAHKEMGSLSKRSTPKSQVQSEDVDKQQVLLKIVSTHKPTLARVENDSPPNPRSKESQSPVEQEEQRRRGSPSVLVSADLETKDHCDNSNDVGKSDCEEIPTYENIFDAVSNADDPVYENFQAIKSEPAVEVANANEKVALLKKRAMPSAQQFEKSEYTSSFDRRQKKLSSKLTNGSEESSEKPSVKVERAKTLISSKSDKSTLRSASSDRSKSSSRLTGSRDNSIKRYKDAKPTKDDTARGAQAKRKNSSKVGAAVQDQNPAISADKNDSSIRSKKPVEVVYQTAVFNMKNEKLSKPSKGKEIKGPRLINDLICGSKLRRPSESKKAIKTAIVSQNTSKRKETPTTMKRQ